jgi:hypothetical protein
LLFFSFTFSLKITILTIHIRSNDNIAVYKYVLKHLDSGGISAHNLLCDGEVTCHCTSKEMPVISVSKVVDTKRIIRKNEGQGGEEAQGVADPTKYTIFCSGADSMTTMP